MGVLRDLSSALATHPNSIHRLIIPTILSPAFYPPHASQPAQVLQFFHSLRALLRKHSDQLTAMITLPLELFPRSTGLVRWMEHLSDGVFELTPFPHPTDEPTLSTSGAATEHEERPQGIFKTHTLPVFHERGGGSAPGLAADRAFTVSRRHFTIRPFSLPPGEVDDGSKDGAEQGNMPKKKDIEF